LEQGLLKEASGSGEEGITAEKASEKAGISLYERKSPF